MGRTTSSCRQDEFEASAALDEFAESAVVHGNLYGTLRSEVKRVLASGKHVIMDIDVQGARQFARAFPESVLVFLLPPSTDVLIGRLRARQTEDHRQAARAIAIGARGAAGSWRGISTWW